MRIIKILVFGALFLSTNIAKAQKETNAKPTVKKIESINLKVEGPEASARIQTEQMTKMLDLTESQVTSVSELNLKVQKKIEAIDVSKMTEEKKREFIEGNLNDRMSVLRRLLTKSQFEEYSASQKK
ncbi:MAG: hypothetical protein KC454_03300 [Flavobacteriales bacterium]|nr:hypothetical protein [Flavobacteriales bacterium]